MYPQSSIFSLSDYSSIISTFSLSDISFSASTSNPDLSSCPSTTLSFKTPFSPVPSRKSASIHSFYGSQSSKLSTITVPLGKPSKKKRQKKLNFFNFGGGGGKKFPKFNFLKDLFKIRFKPFWVILDTLFLVTFRGGVPQILKCFEPPRGKKYFFP